MKTFAITIPEGIRNNEKVRLLGQGKEGVNGGKNGDLFIKINIQNGKKYRLNGLDLYTDLKITPWEAALGTKSKHKFYRRNSFVMYSTRNRKWRKS